MDRLTIRVDDGLDDIYFAVTSDPEGTYNIHDLAQYRTENGDLLTGIAGRLAAYEDTGLTPGDVKDLQALCEENGLAKYVDLIVQAKRQMGKANEDSIEQDERIEQLEAENARLRAELEQVKAERDAAVSCISRNCAHIEFIEGGISYCVLKGAGCDDCEHIWRELKES